MPTIVVTLDVSRVSGWLKSDANCAEWKRGGQQEVSGMRAGKLWIRNRCGAHLKHAIHARDAGRIETQRLVERGCALPSQKEGILRVGRDASRETKGCDGSASGLHRGGSAAEDWGWGYYPKHSFHGFDASRVESQRLVERRRQLPSRMGGIPSKARREPGDGRGCGAAAQAVCRGRPN